MFIHIVSPGPGTVPGIEELLSQRWVNERTWRNKLPLLSAPVPLTSTWASLALHPRVSWSEKEEQG